LGESIVVDATATSDRACDMTTPSPDDTQVIGSSGSEANNSWVIAIVAVLVVVVVVVVAVLVRRGRGNAAISANAGQKPHSSSSPTSNVRDRRSDRFSALSVDDISGPKAASPGARDAWDELGRPRSTVRQRPGLDGRDPCPCIHECDAGCGAC
jgi:hypothetical protein